MSRNVTKSLVIASFGTLIEYYDYALFSLFLPFLAPVFFPAKSAYDALIMGFYAILIASVARPLGGLFFGYIGDRYGRKISLVISLYGIALATLFIGILPSYAQIGVSAAIVLTIVRSVQLFCYGGEYSGAGIYVVELAKSKNTAFIGALLSAMALVGSVVAAIVGIILTSVNKTDPNWRLGFILGGVVGLIAIYFRRGMTESVSKHELIKSPSLLSILKSQPRALFAGFCIGGFITVPFTTVLTFINPVLKTKDLMNAMQFMQFQFVLSTIAVITLVTAGFFADKLSPIKVMRTASILLIILAWPLGMLLDSSNLYFILGTEIVLVVINEILLGPSNAYLKQIFPINCRYRGVAFSFCLGMAVLGGLTPIVENSLYQITGYLQSVAIWLVFISGLTCIAFSLAKPLPQLEIS